MNPIPPLKPFLTTFTDEVAHVILKAANLGLGIAALRVYSTLRLASAPLNRRQIAQVLHITPEAAHFILKDLTEQGLILRLPGAMRPRRGGRPSSLYRAVKGEPA